MPRLKRIKTPFSQRMKRARVRVIPFVIWVGCIFIAVDLWRAGPRTGVFHGFAHAPDATLTSPVDGTLSSILVELYQTVSQGDLIAIFDTAELDASLETGRAEYSRIESEMASQLAEIRAADQAARLDAEWRQGVAQSVSSLEYPAELRAFHADEADLEFAILDTRLRLAISDSEIERLGVTLRRARQLAKEDVGPRSNVEDLEKRLVVEQTRAASLREVLDNRNEALVTAQNRRQQLEATYESIPIKPLLESQLESRLARWSAALVVQQKRIDEIAVQRESYFLRAGSDGRVASIVASPGEFMQAGEPLLTVARTNADEVSMWIAESAIEVPQLGDKFLVVKTTAPRFGENSECSVVAVSPRVEALPERLWRDARIAEYGRAYMIGSTSSLGLVPGERVQIDPIDRTTQSE